MAESSRYFHSAVLRGMFGRDPDDESGVLRGCRMALLVVLADKPDASKLDVFYDRMEQLGMTRAAIDDLKSFDPTGQSPLEYFPKHVLQAGAGHSRRLVYMLFVAAMSDGQIGAGERTLIEKIATRLDVSPAMLASLEALVLAEHATDRLRLSLFQDVL